MFSSRARSILSALHVPLPHQPCNSSLLLVLPSVRLVSPRNPTLTFARSFSLKSLFSHPSADVSTPDRPPVLSPDHLFHPLSKSPIRQMRDRATLINKYGSCPVCYEEACAGDDANKTDAKAKHAKAKHAHECKAPTYECSDCGYPTHCSEGHYLSGKAEHNKYCAALREANEDEHDLRSGRKMPEFNFPGAQGFDEVVNMANWDVFFYTRGFPSMDTERSMRHVSKLLTHPITIASTLHQSSPFKVGKELTPEGLRSIAALRTTLYPREELAKDGVTLLPTDTIRIFLVGARAEASLPPHIWLQLAHLFPQTPFHIHFIGPDAIPSKGVPNKPFSTSLDARLTFTYDPSFYHQYHERIGGTTHFDPYRDVFFLFSPGFAHPLTRNGWRSSVANMLETKCAVFVTGFDEEDMKGDMAAFEKSHEEFDWILKPGENVFRSLKRDVNLEDLRHQIFANWGIWGVRGKRYEVTQPDEE